MSAKMIGGSTKLVPSAELRRLRTGSYESKIAEAAQIVRGRLGDVPFEIVATRETEALVCMEGRFHRVPLRGESSAKPQVIDVEVFDESNVRAFAEREAHTIADLFLRGSVKTAVVRLENLVPFVPSSMGLPRDVLRVEAAVQAPRTWRRIFEARRDFIAQFIGDDQATLVAGRLRPCFGKLYDGSIEEGNLSECSTQVTEELGVVLDRLKGIGEAVVEARKSMALVEATESNEVWQSFRAFADDLSLDITMIRDTASKVLESLVDVSARGKLCDILIEALYDREVAGRFVVVVADRMAEAN